MPERLNGTLKVADHNVAATVHSLEAYFMALGVDFGH